nr:MAG TPA: hypothetical protein [Caudoviricetes sp.]
MKRIQQHRLNLVVKHIIIIINLILIHPLQ